MEQAKELQQDTSSHQRDEGKRLKAGTAHTISGHAQKIGGDLKFEKNPAFIKERKEYFEQLYTIQQQKYDCKLS